MSELDALLEDLVADLCRNRRLEFPAQKIVLAFALADSAPIGGGKTTSVLISRRRRIAWLGLMPGQQSARALQVLGLCFSFVRLEPHHILLLQRPVLFRLLGR